MNDQHTTMDFENNDTLLKLSLKNVFPANNFKPNAYISSTVNGSFSRSMIITYAKAFCFLLSDSAKCQLGKAVESCTEEDDEVRSLLQEITSVQDTSDLVRCFEELLTHMENVLRIFNIDEDNDEEDDYSMLVVEQNEDNVKKSLQQLDVLRDIISENNGNEVPEQPDEQKNLKNLAKTNKIVKEALYAVLQTLINDKDTFDRQLQLDRTLSKLIIQQETEELSIDELKSDGVNYFVSWLIRESINSISITSQTLFAFMIRFYLFVAFHLVNYLSQWDSFTVQFQPSETDTKDQLMYEQMVSLLAVSNKGTSAGFVDTKCWISTMIISSVRFLFIHQLEWPQRLWIASRSERIFGDHIVKLSMDQFARILVMSRRFGKSNASGSLQWLNCVRANDKEYRVYVNFENIIQTLSELNNNMKSTSAEQKTSDPKIYQRHQMIQNVQKICEKALLGAINLYDKDRKLIQQGVTEFQFEEITGTDIEQVTASCLFPLLSALDFNNKNRKSTELRYDPIDSEDTKDTRNLLMDVLISETMFRIRRTNTKVVRNMMNVLRQIWNNYYGICTVDNLQHFAIKLFEFKSLLD